MSSRIEALRTKRNQVIIFFLSIILIFSYLFYFQVVEELFLVLFLIYLIAVGLMFKVSEKIHFIISLFFLLLTPFFLISKRMFYAEKLSILNYLLLISGLFVWSCKKISIFLLKKSPHESYK